MVGPIVGEGDQRKGAWAFASAEEINYELKLPWGARTDRVSNAILRLDGQNEVAVEWEEKKKKST